MIYLLRFQLLLCIHLFYSCNLPGLQCDLLVFLNPKQMHESLIKKSDLKKKTLQKMSRATDQHQKANQSHEKFYLT